MSRNSTMDLTTGHPLKQLLFFSLPLVAGTLFQQLYSFADTVMVGRFLGESALAAVGTTYSLHFLTLGFVLGACAGFGIPLAQAVGAKDRDEFRRYFWNGVWLCCLLGVAFTALTYAFAVPMLRLIHTPEEILPQAASYIRIIFLGIPASILYNFCAGALRAAGDSRRPTLFLLVSSFLNIVLDYLLLAVFPLGVVGAALATVVSQLVSGLLNLYWLACKTDLLQSCAGLRGFSRRHAAALCRVGLPMESVGMGMATFVGQNEGTRRYDRIRQGIRDGLIIQWIYCAAAWVVLFFGKTAFTQMVLGHASDQAAALSVEYLSVISCLFCFHGTLMILRNTLQGMGYSLHAVLSGVGELIGRAVCGWAAVSSSSFLGICLANPAAWALALAYCTGMTIHFLKQRQTQPC